MDRGFALTVKHFHHQLMLSWVDSGVLHQVHWVPYRCKVKKWSGSHLQLRRKKKGYHDDSSSNAHHPQVQLSTCPWRPPGVERGKDHHRGVHLGQMLWCWMRTVHQTGTYAWWNSPEKEHCHSHHWCRGAGLQCLTMVVALVTRNKLCIQWSDLHPVTTQQIYSKNQNLI